MPPRVITPERRGRAGIHGTWRGETRERGEEKIPVTIVSCPRCAADTELQQLVARRSGRELPLYQINAYGVVQPRFACSAGCGFIALIVLQQWSAVLKGLT